MPHVMMDMEIRVVVMPVFGPFVKIKRNGVKVPTYASVLARRERLVAFALLRVKNSAINRM